MANGTNTTLNYSGMLNVDGSAQTATGGTPVGTGNGGSATLNASGNIFKPLGTSFLFTGTSIGANGVGGQWRQRDDHRQRQHFECLHLAHQHRAFIRSPGRHRRQIRQRQCEP